MKPNEITKEGIWGNIKDYMAQRGAFGTTAGIAATARGIAKKQAALRKGSEQVLRQKFIANLEVALEKAINAQRVTIPIPESIVDYNNFNKILESKFLTEAVTVEVYVNEYIKTLLSKYMPLDTEDQKSLTKIIKDFATSYKGPGQPFPTDIAGILSDFVSSIKTDKGQDDSSGLRTDYALPKQDSKVEDSKGNEYLYKEADKKWYSTNDGVNPDQEITNTKSIQALNKMHREQQGSTMGLRTGTAPPKADVTVTYNNYDYKYFATSKKWFELDDSTPPNPTKEINDPKGIEYLNKLAFNTNLNYPKKDIPSIVSRTSGRKFKFDLRATKWYELDATGATVSAISDSDDIRELNKLAAASGGGIT